MAATASPASAPRPNANWFTICPAIVECECGGRGRGEVVRGAQFRTVESRPAGDITPVRAPGAYMAVQQNRPAGSGTVADLAVAAGGEDVAGAGLDHRIFPEGHPAQRAVEAEPLQHAQYVECRLAAHVVEG